VEGIVRRGLGAAHNSRVWVSSWEALWGSWVKNLRKRFLCCYLRPFPVMPCALLLLP
jgi:hypothetical protein